jgi:uncharacterized membrane protein YkvA (DUF1232 family)
MMLIPEGLNHDIFDSLNECSKKASDRPPKFLLRAAIRHVERTRRSYVRNPLINLPLAEAICEVIKKLVKDWENIPKYARFWCKGMFLYFISSNDEEPDFASPIGFDDDADVLNACLRLAGREDLCINPEDYDDV